MADTRQILIEQATVLIRSRSYSSISYNDLSAIVGIRKPSIHHHFPSKEDLGLAVVNAYHDKFVAKLARIDQEQVSPMDRILAYALIYQSARGKNLGCVCGVLAAEMGSLPLTIQDRLRTFFDYHLNWLERTLISGWQNGEILKQGTPRQQAAMVINSLQGMLLVGRLSEDKSIFDDTVAGIDAMLRAEVDTYALQYGVPVGRAS
ncbi:TetR/AcrR family transcriptional regulator [Ampullimonas aquatilis]|uniref:TetR/AcrR family transcriptional regulator n=1 Tax=Ampullimonas aquatilis TaxID=1341549 RepID=UPI003C753079